MAFNHTARCPVCGDVLDTITTPDRELSGVTAVLLLQDERTKHGITHPDCAKSKRWICGWEIDEPVETK